MLHRAVQESGQIELDGQAIASRLAAYAQAGGIEINDPAFIPYWGGAFLAWVAIKDGLTPPLKSSDPESWRTWGHPLAEPTAGAVVVLTGGRGAQGHMVGLIARASGTRAHVIGAHDGAVQMRVFGYEQIIEVRRPPTVVLTVVDAISQTTPVEVRVVIETPAAAAHWGGDPPLPRTNPPQTRPNWQRSGDVTDLEIVSEPGQRPAAASVPAVYPVVTPYDLESRRWQAMAEIAGRVDAIQHRHPEPSRVAFVASVAVLAADALRSAGNLEQINMAHADVVAALDHRQTRAQ